MAIFEKRLTESEKDRHWVRIPARFWNLFPKGGPETSVKVRYKGIGVRIVELDRFYRLNVGAEVISALGLDEPGAAIRIEKCGDEYRLARVE